ncbi:MAG: hypothetical protein Tsb009_25240 [Planctomycetaceae bacterium]
MHASQLSFNMQDRIDSELESGETVVWAGQPLPGQFARRAIPVALFGIPFTAFSIFWIVTAAVGIGEGFQQGDDFVPKIFACFPLFGVPFLLVGLGLVSAPYWAARRARKTLYALTNRRAIIWEAGWWKSVTIRSFRGDDLKKMIRKERSDGTGDLIFEDMTQLIQAHSDGVHLARHQVGFLGVENVRELERLVKETLLHSSD